MQYQLTIDDFIGAWGYSKRYVRSVLSNYKNRHVDVAISSLGGDLNHALDIRQQFIDHGDVTVHLRGFVASAATVISMGAKRVVMSRYAMFLVHKCSNFIDAWGSYNADQMQQLIEQLTENKKENDKIDVVLANMYAERCGKKVSEILDILKRGAWMTAQEALDLGFIDEISDDAAGTKLNCSAEMFAKLNAFGITTDGIPAPEEPKVDAVEKPITQDTMKTYKFNAAEKVLDMKDITPDNEGYVSVKAEEFEKLSDKLDSLETSLAEKNTALTDSEAKVTNLETKVNDLTTQVENLKKLPADSTDDIKDDAGEEKLTSEDMFNSVKDLI